jgi:hypothetical protein
MLDSYNTAINERYRIIRSQVWLWNTRYKKQKKRDNSIKNFIQRARADYKGKFPTKYWVQGFNKRISEKRDLYKSLQLVTLYSGT